MPASGTVSLDPWPSSVWDATGEDLSTSQHNPDTANGQMTTTLPDYQCVAILATHPGFPIPALKIQEQQAQEAGPVTHPSPLAGHPGPPAALSTFPHLWLFS